MKKLKPGIKELKPGREKRREYDRAYYKANRDKLNVQHRKWYLKNREHVLDYMKEYLKRPGKRERARALQRICRAKNRENYRRLERECYWRNVEVRRKKALKAAAKLRMRCSVDPKVYAQHRAIRRMYYLLNTERKSGRKYAPRPKCRIPDWARKGEKLVDVRSQWLVENHTAGAAGYARELAIGRKEWRMK